MVDTQRTFTLHLAAGGTEELAPQRADPSPPAVGALDDLCEVVVVGEGTDAGRTFRALADGARTRGSATGNPVQAGTATRAPGTSPLPARPSIADAPGFTVARSAPTSRALALRAASDGIREGLVVPGGPFAAVPIVDDRFVLRHAVTVSIVLQYGDLLIDAPVDDVVRSRSPDAAEVEVVYDECTSEIVTSVTPARMTGYSVTGIERTFPDLASAMESALDRAEESPGTTIGVDRVTRGVDGPLVAVSKDVVRREIAARAVSHEVDPTAPVSGYVFFGVTTSRVLRQPVPVRG